MDHATNQPATPANERLTACRKCGCTTTNRLSKYCTGSQYGYVDSPHEWVIMPKFEADSIAVARKTWTKDHNPHPQTALVGVLTVGSNMPRPIRQLADLEREEILYAVEQCRTLDDAAEALDISTRTLQRKLKQYQRKQ